VTLPDSPRGYRVTVETATVHLRYADHAPTATRTKTREGVASLLGDRTPNLCTVCFPSARPTVKRVGATKRATPARTRTTRAPRRPTARVTSSIVPTFVEDLAELPPVDELEDAGE
jgi:hypothetical protein